MNWWEWTLSCGLVFAGHVRTLVRTYLPPLRDEPAEPKPYDGPLIDRTDPEDLEAYARAAEEDYRRAQLAHEVEQAFRNNAYRMVILPDVVQTEMITEDALPPVTPLGVTRTPYLDEMYRMLTSHECRACGRRSYNDKDVQHHYCGYCHHFCQDSGEYWE